MYKPHPKNSCAGGYGNCLDVKFTNECNGACEFCIEKNGYCPSPVPVSRLVSATLDDPSENVLILGGEPMLDLDGLEKYLKAVRPFKEKIYMTTNGSLLDGSSAMRIGPYLDAVNISVHHYDPARNDQVYKTCHVDFKRMAQGITTLHAHGCTVRINANLVLGYLDSKPDIMNFVSFALNELHADEIRFTELQKCDELWVDARSVMPVGNKLPDDPFAAGCEQEIKILDGIKTVVKMGCGLVCEARRPKDPDKYHDLLAAAPKHRKTRVLYPDGIVRDGWIMPASSLPPDPKPSPSQQFASWVMGQRAPAAAMPFARLDDCHAARWAPPAGDCHGARFGTGSGCH